jgi:hypothetical protein
MQILNEVITRNAMEGRGFFVDERGIEIAL